MASAVPELREYASSHTTPGNRACHWIGIPMIVTALSGLLSRVPLGLDIAGVPLTMAELLFAGAILYYARLDLVLALLMIPVVIPIDALGRWLPVWANVALFLVGWVFQLVGHAVYEKKSPAFFRNLIHLLIGPLFLLAKAVRRA
jgi:uncharacterized membrane protein YGL010W